MPRPSSVAASAAKPSQTVSARPTKPSSAATVTGVVWDAALFGSAPFRPVRSAYAFLKPPAPTPSTGCAAAIRIPCETRFARPLVMAFTPERPWPTRSCRTLGKPKLAATTTAASPTSPATARHPQTIAAATTTPVPSAT